MGLISFSIVILSCFAKDLLVSIRNWKMLRFTQHDKWTYSSLFVTLSCFAKDLLVSIRNWKMLPCALHDKKRLRIREEKSDLQQVLTN
jgi:hypothetical protein